MTFHGMKPVYNVTCSAPSMCEGDPMGPEVAGDPIGHDRDLRK